MAGKHLHRIVQGMTKSLRDRGYATVPDRIVMASWRRRQVNGELLSPLPADLAECGPLACFGGHGKHRIAEGNSLPTPRCAGTRNPVV